MSEAKALHVLIAPVGQLSANGQLRETVKERRKKRGPNVPFWYLSPELVKKFDLPGTGVEAVVAEDLTAINWLKLRFGGESSIVQIDLDLLREYATDLPPLPTHRDISE
ncbi:hypothetical protein [Prochlorococcus sp. MIT 1307]|uniref:hypothetical protein n=1 Tax=Prochlorococcus sp. MIT 1307 TaxID=3096219 RepID=UPI002A74A2F2|nr:hypothetical protein [Prochlorococcus sp. MIT 1307]